MASFLMCDAVSQPSKFFHRFFSGNLRKLRHCELYGDQVKSDIADRRERLSRRARSFLFKTKLACLFNIFQCFLERIPLAVASVKSWIAYKISALFLLTNDNRKSIVFFYSNISHSFILAGNVESVKLQTSTASPPILRRHSARLFSEFFESRFLELSYLCLQSKVPFLFAQLSC